VDSGGELLLIESNKYFDFYKHVDKNCNDYFETGTSTSSSIELITS
jgi:hypothetical protein